MRGVRAKALRQMAMNQWIEALVENKLNPAEIPTRALVRSKRNPNQAINHPHTARALYRLMKQSYKRYMSNPLRDPRVHA